MIDETPTTITLPAHAWKTVQEACVAHAHRLRRRGRARTPSDRTDIEALRAATLDEAAETIEANSWRIQG